MNNDMRKSQFQNLLANKSNKKSNNKTSKKNNKNSTQKGGKSKKIYTGQRGGKYYYKKVNNKMVKRYI